LNELLRHVAIFDFEGLLPTFDVSGRRQRRRSADVDRKAEAINQGFERGLGKRRGAVDIQTRHTGVARIAVCDENRALRKPELATHHLLSKHENQNVDRKTATRVVCCDADSKPGRLCRFE